MRTQDIDELRRDPDRIWWEAMRLIAKNYDRLMELEREEKERYLSFLKKRVLMEWRKVRTRRRHPGEVWEVMFPILHAAFMEDHNRFSIISLYWWIVGLKDTAESLGRLEEARLWGEMEEWIGELRHRRIPHV